MIEYKQLIPHCRNTLIIIGLLAYLHFGCKSSDVHFFVLFSILIQLYNIHTNINNGGLSANGELAYLLRDSLSHLSNFLGGFQQVFSTSRHDLRQQLIRCQPLYWSLYGKRSHQ